MSKTDKTSDMASTGKQIGLNINANKTRILKVNTKSNEPIQLDTTSIEEVSDFVYLGSKITSDGNSMAEVQAHIAKARGAFASLSIIWRSTKIITTTKLKIFKSSVLGVLLYGAESWKITNSIINKLDVFKTRCHPDKMSTKNFAYLLASDHLQCRTVLEKHCTAVTGNQAKKMAVDWACLQIAPGFHHKGSNEMDTIRQEEERTTQGNLESVG